VCFPLSSPTTPRDTLNRRALNRARGTHGGACSRRLVNIIGQIALARDIRSAEGRKASKLNLND
jgi:hypothetical protein